MKPLDTRTTLHLRCGSDIRDGLKAAGFVGDFLEFSDPFCQGPVLDLPRGTFIETRAGFIAGSYDMAKDAILERLRGEYDALDRLGDYDHVVLWFEHDSYDQLILAFLMDAIATTRPETSIEVISVDHAPDSEGLDRFIGVGQLSTDGLIWCWENHRMPLTEDMLTFGRKAWDALRATDPTDLMALARTQNAPLPHMPAALKRHLAELPDPQTGLSLTQKLTLQIITDHGPLPAGKIFGHLTRTYDPLPYLGDLMFWRELEWMTDTKDPLFNVSPTSPQTNWADRTLTLTDAGQEILAGNRNFLETFTGTRWVGGIRIHPSHAA